jgi:hypothetical protein
VEEEEEKNRWDKKDMPYTRSEISVMLKKADR